MPYPARRWLADRLRKTKRSRYEPIGGQALVEFAMAVVPLLTVVFAVIEFSWAIYTYSTVNNAANEGARRGMVLNRPKENYNISGNSSGTYTNPTCSTATNATIIQVIGCQVGVLPKSRFTIQLSTPDPTKFQNNNDVPPGNPISVTVQYAYTPIIMFPLNQSFTMTGYAQTQTQ